MFLQKAQFGVAGKAACGARRDLPHREDLRARLARKLWTNVPVRAGCNRFTVYNAAQYVVTGGYVGNISTNGT